MHQIKILVVYHERREVHIGEGETREMEDNLVVSEREIFEFTCE
jgi:hypothetical protein